MSKAPIINRSGNKCYCIGCGLKIYDAIQHKKYCKGKLVKRKKPTNKGEAGNHGN